MIVLLENEMLGKIYVDFDGYCSSWTKFPDKLIKYIEQMYKHSPDNTYKFNSIEECITHIRTTRPEWGSITCTNSYKDKQEFMQACPELFI